MLQWPVWEYIFIKRRKVFEQIRVGYGMKYIFVTVWWISGRHKSVTHRNSKVAYFEQWDQVREFRRETMNRAAKHIGTG